MSVPPTDEQLAYWENKVPLGFAEVNALTQEVRRLKGLVEDRGEAIARAGTAEAEVERLREELGAVNLQLPRFEVDELVDEIARTNPLTDPERFDALFEAFLDEWVRRHG